MYYCFYNVVLYHGGWGDMIVKDVKSEVGRMPSDLAVVELEEIT